MGDWDTRILKNVKKNFIKNKALTAFMIIWATGRLGYMNYGYNVKIWQNKYIHIHIGD